MAKYNLAIIHIARLPGAYYAAFTANSITLHFIFLKP